MQELTEGKTLRLGDTKALGELYKNRVKCQNTLQNCGSTALLESDDTLLKIVRRLPNVLRAKWVDRASAIEDLTEINANLWK